MSTAQILWCSAKDNTNYRSHQTITSTNQRTCNRYAGWVESCTMNLITQSVGRCTFLHAVQMCLKQKTDRQSQHLLHRPLEAIGSIDQLWVGRQLKSGPSQITCCWRDRVIIGGEHMGARVGVPVLVWGAHALRHWGVLGAPPWRQLARPTDWPTRRRLERPEGALPDACAPPGKRGAGARPPPPPPRVLFPVPRLTLNDSGSNSLKTMHASVPLRSVMQWMV